MCDFNDLCYDCPCMIPKKKRPATSAYRTPVLRIAKKYGATNVRIFGSHARGEETHKSDLDLLVKMPRSTSIIDLSGMKQDLEKATGKKVDVVMDGTIKPALKKSISQDARFL